MREDKTYTEGFDKEGHLDENGISIYVDYLKGRATALPEKIRQHVADCATCRLAVMEVADLLDRVEEPAAEYAAQTDRQPTVAPKRKSTCLWRVVGRIAAGLAAVLVLAWFIQKMLPDRQSSTHIAGKHTTDSIFSTYTKDSTSFIPDTIRYAQAFTPDPAYENLMKARYRGINRSELQAPAAATHLAPGDTLWMHWKPKQGEQYLIRIIDNHEKEVALIHPSSPGEVAWTIRLKPGRYYWKFEGEKELYKVGSILVMRDN